MNILDRFVARHELGQRLAKLEETRSGRNSEDAEAIRNVIASLDQEKERANAEYLQKLANSEAPFSQEIVDASREWPGSTQDALAERLTADELFSEPIRPFESLPRRVIVEALPKSKIMRLYEAPFFKETLYFVLGILAARFIQ